MLIDVSEMTKVYGEGNTAVHALRGVSLSIDHGEFVAIIGKSGSGKSTLMHMLGCLDKPTTGEYRLDGQSVQDLDEDELAAIRNKKIGFVFQQFNLLRRTTALENVQLPLTYSRDVHLNIDKLAHAALEQVGLGDRIGHWPNEMSGGEQQRVAIARALVNDPSIVMADEPTGALDTKSSGEVMNIFKELNDIGRTIIVITHEPSIAILAKRIVRIQDGEIFSDKPVEENGITDSIERERPGH